VKIVLLSFFLLTALAAQESGETSFEYTKRVRDELEAIKNLSSEEYFLKVDGMRVEIEKYIDHKRRVCNGEFSTVVLTEKEDISVRPKANKLTKEERKLCFRELKALQNTFINNMFVARKAYLDQLHKQRIEDLSKMREEAIKNLNSAFEKETI
jgi:hypothetical protein